MIKPASTPPLPFSAGKDWVYQGVGLLRTHTLRLMVMALVLQFIAGFSQAGVLALLFILAIPVFTAGMLQGVHTAGSGDRPSMFELFAAFSEPSRLGRLVLLGAIGGACMIFAAAFALAGSLGELDPALLMRIEDGDVNAVNELDPRIIQRVLMGLLAGLLLAACFSFYAVPLVWFTNAPLGKAIAHGFLAMLRQWRALTVMGALLALLSIPVAVLTVFVLTTQLVDGTASPVLTLLLLLVGVFYQLLLFSTQYTSFMAVFGVAVDGSGGDEAGRREARSREDQLVA